MNDILFSLHGPDSDVHDGLTGVPGSFDKLLRAMENAATLPIRRRSNTVVNGLNYTRLEEIVALMGERKIERANFILFNPVVEARGADAEISLRYREAAPYLRRLVREHADEFDRMTIRYFPVCLLPDCAARIVNWPRVQYDPDEWDYLWRTYFWKGFGPWLADLARGFFHHPAPARLLRLNFREVLREAAVWGIITENMRKGLRCRSCRYDRVCDGLWRDYAEKFGFNELEPVAGAPPTGPITVYGGSAAREFSE